MGINHNSYKLLNGADLNRLFDAECQATYETFKSHKINARKIELNKLDEHNLGWLMFNCVLETLCVAYIWQIDPFDQPAVEHGKKRTLEILSEL